MRVEIKSTAFICRDLRMIIPVEFVLDPSGVFAASTSQGENA